MHEIISSIHIHSVYSDGMKTPLEIAREASQQGLDVIMITDHNVFPSGFNGYHYFEGRQILLITGEEIHDQKRQPQKNHLLALGIRNDLSRLAARPQELIDAIEADGGLSFIAHAYDPALEMFDEDDLSWEDWSVQGFTGLEIWNNLSEFKLRVSNMLQAAFLAFFPENMAVEPPRQIRAIWDALLSKGQKVVAIGGADAHTLPFHFGPFTKHVFPYSYHFRAITTHLILEVGLSGNTETDTLAILDALRSGHAFVAYDLIKPAFGFRFYLEDNGVTIPMGDQLGFRPGQRITAILPSPADCRLLRDGQVLDARRVKDKYSWSVDKPGVYRLECYRTYRAKKRGWIFSNPLYITAH